MRTLVVRAALVAALGTYACTSPARVDPIAIAVSDLAGADPTASHLAADRLVSIGHPAVSPLRDALNGNDRRLSRRALEVLAKITGQWGGDGSGIQWNRAWDEALAEAVRTAKPILLLHIFGRLDEELC